MIKRGVTVRTGTGLSPYKHQYSFLEFALMLVCGGGSGPGWISVAEINHNGMADERGTIGTTRDTSSTQAKSKLTL